MTVIKVVLAASLYFINSFTYAQDCIVELPLLAGKYEGECDKGKAHGQGKASGIDIYEGNFQKGYPHGKGTYTWSEGPYSFYVGNFKKGLKEGYGEMHHKPESGGDSIVTGYWKKDKYIGPYQNPYEVISMTGNVLKVDCRIRTKGGNTLLINVARLSSGVERIVSIDVQAGQYNNQNTQVLTNVSVTTLRQIDFPFKARFTTSSGAIIEILFNEVAEYDVDIKVQ